MALWVVRVGVVGICEHRLIGMNLRTACAVRAVCDMCAEGSPSRMHFVCMQLVGATLLACSSIACEVVVFMESVAVVCPISVYL